MAAAKTLTKQTLAYCGLVPVARDRRDTPLDPQWQASLHKDGATWSWFTRNPEGGGFGTNAVTTLGDALARALSNVPKMTPVRVLVDDCDRGVFMKVERDRG